MTGLRFSIEITDDQAAMFDGPPRGRAMRVTAGGNGVLWADRRGIGARSRRRYVAWVRPGAWCSLSDRQTAEGRLGRFIHRLTSAESEALS